jgi:SM-20-related protein
MLDLQRIALHKMETAPYQWAFIDRLFAAADAARLAASFPQDGFKKVAGHDGEKGYEYLSRSLIHMGATVPSHRDGLSAAWQELVGDLLSAEYRAALKQMSGLDLAATAMEVNVLQYGPGAFLGPHVDLRAKKVTHTMYFNAAWNAQHGGSINILRSADPGDVLIQIPPMVGSSVLLVRSRKSWHSVSRVAQDCGMTRRSINVIFHRPGSVSTMWPPGGRPAE